MNELRDLLRDNAETAPHDDGDLAAVLTGGRRRVRRRRLTGAGGVAIVGAAAVGLGSFVWGPPPDLPAAGVPSPAAPTLRLGDARAAVEGDDYRVLASHTNQNLDRDNGQYLDGLTEDGLVLFRDGPRMEQVEPRYALLDPATGEKAWLPQAPVTDDSQLWPVELGTDRLVLTGLRFDASDGSARIFALVYDRGTRGWERIDWPALPTSENPSPALVGHDGRLYVRVPATEGKPPPGGWPTGPGGEADDADAEGDAYRLWSASLTDPSDVRDEGLTLGGLAFTDHLMVWTDATNGDSGRVHVRDLDTGEERSFDPQSGERCNLLSFGATDEHVVMGQYCGTYDAGLRDVRDDRVQILSTDGDQVVTLQDSEVDGGLSPRTDVVTVSAYQRGRAGTYVYDLATERFLRVSEGTSSWSTGGPLAPGHFAWDVPVNRGNGATFRIGELAE